MGYLIVVAAAALLGFLEFRVVDAPLLVQVAFGLALGGLWTGLGVLVTRRLRRSPRRAAGTAMAAAIANAMLLAPGIILHLMYSTPTRYLAVQQSPAGASTVAYYAILNPLTEWVLVPLALWLAWPDRRTRTPILVAAALYYLERAATYLYFAPAILAWPHRQTTPTLLEQVTVWLHLDVARMVVNGVAIALFAVSALRNMAVTDRAPTMPTPA